MRRLQSGFSLLSVLVALGIAGIIAVAMSQMLSNSSRHQRSIELATDVSALKRIISQRIDCKRSTADRTCTNGTYVPLWLSNNSNLIGEHDENGFPVGSWHMRSRCTDAGLVIQAARFKPGTTEFARDPLTNKAQNWQSLFEANALPCPRLEDGEGKSMMGGLCRYITHDWTRGADGVELHEGGRRSMTYKCPANFPILLSVDEGGSCNAVNVAANGTDFVNGLPTGMRCTLRFLEDRDDISPAKMTNMINECNAGGKPYKKASCAMTCCKD